MRELKEDRGIDGLSNSGHDISSKDPEDIVEEKPGQKDQTGLKASQVEVLNTIDREGNAEQVIGDPVSLVDMADTDSRSEEQSNQVMGVVFDVEKIFLNKKSTLKKVRIRLTVLSMFA